MKLLPIQSMPASIVICLLASLFIASGCGKAKAPPVPTGTLNGSVTFQGQPVEGSISIYSRDIGHGGRADFASNGSYRLENLPLGTYEISIRPPAPPTPAEISVDAQPELDPADIPRRYRSPQASKLIVEIQKGENEFSLDMKK